MTANYPEYESYLEINLPWVKRIPGHWRVTRGKQIFSPIDKRSKTGEEELLSVSSERGVIPRKSAKVTMFKAESYKGYKLCWPNDLVINSIWAWAKGLGISSYHGIISSAYGVYRINDHSSIDPRFIHYFVRSTPFQWELQVRSKGIWTSRLQLTDDSFLNAPFITPPIDEQRAIVKYLDYVDRRIKKYIRAKQKLIKLLEEQKQAIIHQAVTRGLDPNVPLKPSGVEWLGDIPAHWEIKKLRSANKEIISGIWGNEPNNQDDVICIRVADFDREQRLVNLDNLTLRSINPLEKEKRILKEGNLLLEKSGGGDKQPVGTIVLYDHKLEAVCSNFISRIQIAKEYDSKYIVYLHSFLYSIRLNVKSIKQTTGIQNLDTYMYFDEKVAFPPYNEQVEISLYLTKKQSEIDNLRNIAKDEIAKIKEYRNRLIADVVTGKVDVRAAARQLPDEMEALFEDNEEMIEDENEREEEMEEAVMEEE